MKEFVIGMCKGATLAIFCSVPLITLGIIFLCSSFDEAYRCTIIAVVLLLIQLGCKEVCNIKASKWCITSCLIATSIGVVQMNNINSKVIDKTNDINTYLNYYGATETLLDSLNVDVDNPILETDEGSMYLLYANKVDSIINSNR